MTCTPSVVPATAGVSESFQEVAALGYRLRLALTDGGESFHRLGAAEPTTLPADVLVFRDDETILSQFGYRDGEKSKVTAATENIWLVGLQVPGIGTDDVRTGLDRAIALLERGYDVSFNPE